MKKLILSTAILFAGFAATAQQDAEWTQNMFNKLSINPGSAGHNRGICATLLTRSQWMGFDGRPQTHLFSADTRIGNTNHGVGLTIFQDKLGIESSFVGKLAYAYHINSLGPGELGIGIDLGVVSKSFGSNFIAIDDPINDPSIPNANTSALSFDAGLGLYYEIPNKMYVGISAIHLPQSELKDVADDGGKGALSYAQSIHYYIMAGYDFNINGRQWVITPSILAKTDAASTDLDVNVIAMFNELVWAGASYKIQDAVAVLAGVNIPQVEGLKFGVSYDLTTSALSDHSSGSLEFMLRYCKTFSSPFTRERYLDVRML